MEAIRTIWSFVLLFSLIAFPQLAGILLFFRIKRFAHLLAHLLGFLIPIVLSVGFAWMIFIYRYYQAHPDDHDGGQLFGASIIILSVFCMQIVFGAIAQITLHAKINNCAGK